uniref:Uncharacterized protein n=1 Tax=Panagrolaimus sp. PS1159 TaxID=55785 RepID=A0AC35GRS9_9BILA
MARSVLFTERPTPHPRKYANAAAAAAARRSSSSDSEESAPIVRKNQSRRSKKGSRSSNSNSSRRRGIRSKRGFVSRRKQREDGRASPKERKRKSQLARKLPRHSNGTFAPIGFVTPPNRSSKPQQQEESDPEESFLNTTGPKLPPGRYINDLVQTPEGQKRLQRNIVKSVEKVLAKTIEKLGEGTRLNFDSDSDDKDSGEESFLNSTGPKLPAGKYIQQFVQTPEYQKMLKKQLMKTLNEMGGSLLNFDSDDEKQGRKKNPTSPHQRRSSRPKM